MSKTETNVEDREVDDDLESILVDDESDNDSISDRQKFVAYMDGNNKFMVMCVGTEHPKVLRWHMVGAERLIGSFFVDNVGNRNVTFHPVPCEWNCIYPTLEEIRRDMPLFADLIFHVFFKGIDAGTTPWKCILTKITRNQLSLKHTMEEKGICHACIGYMIYRCHRWIESEESVKLMRTGQLYTAILKILGIIDMLWNTNMSCAYHDMQWKRHHDEQQMDSTTKENLKH